MKCFISWPHILDSARPQRHGIFSALTQEYPHSKYVNEALVQLGDHYFDHNDSYTRKRTNDRLIAKKHKPLMLILTTRKLGAPTTTQHISASLQHFKYSSQRITSLKIVRCAWSRRHWETLHCPLLNSDWLTIHYLSLRPTAGTLTAKGLAPWLLFTLKRRLISHRSVL